MPNGKKHFELRSECALARVTGGLGERVNSGPTGRPGNTA